ncbi:P-loop containing nucleoside triphosphate hydrolase protein [Trametopsis cervina]|nr:P-loop containing nucleoside triphosphate hydrolase protein [Trametopsis cervina]
MSPRVYAVRSEAFTDISDRHEATVLQETELNAERIRQFLASAAGRPLGVAASYGPKGVLYSLALSTETRTLHILMQKVSPRSQQRPKRRSPDSRKLLQDEILCNASYHKLAFDAERVTTALFLDHDMHTKGLIDVQSLVLRKSGRQSIGALKTLFEGQIADERAVVRIFDRRLRHGDPKDDNVLRACATWGIGSRYASEIAKALPIDTSALDDRVLIAVAKIVRDADQLEAIKPTRVKNDVAAKFGGESGSVQVTLQRYKTRLRRGGRQKIVVETAIKGSKPVHNTGTVRGTDGKSASLNVALNQRQLALGEIRSVHTFGPEDPTSAEYARTDVVLKVLQGDSNFFSLPIVRTIFLGGQKTAGTPLHSLSPDVYFSLSLNDSQTRAVLDIISPKQRKAVVVIQGAPGTGKTTVISASVQILTSLQSWIGEHGIYVVAQSNVAVKNMAEKLVNVGFHDFKVLVSHEFHFDWHEHLYGDILNENVITSDRFHKGKTDAATLLNGSRVILCTLSMFSNQRAAVFAATVPVDVVIVDEASQIELGDYIPLLNKHGERIKKLVFIGDDQQLAPFGQDDLKTLRSIFEMANVRQNAVFLDTQYRMPVPIGEFISRQMYHNRLKSQHNINVRSSCRFVDIAKGKEEKAGNSYKNVEEANYVINIAKRYHEQGKSYRIVTPYDGQRSLIQKYLEKAKLPWEDRCFNVDSFQGLS